MTVTGDLSAHVVVVDDDPSLVRLVQRWLERAGHQVSVCATAAQAIACLEEVLPDVILLDLNLPDGSGLDVLTAAKRAHPLVPVLMLTADNEVSTVVSAMQSGAWDYLTKPVTRPKLLTSVRNAAIQVRTHRRLTHLEHGEDGRGHYGIIGSSPPMELLFRQLERVGPSAVTVLVRGESGTGKELVARALHKASPRAQGPFVAVNCAAIPESLIESELFGHEKGAFTGAHARRAGRFEQANGGTLFLDEIGELAPNVQAKLLRVLQERCLHRLGGADEIRVDVRIVAATHADLQARVADGSFRQDLYFRLAVFELDVPRLQEREGDILALAHHFLRVIATRDGTPLPVLSDAAVALLQGWHWPGNVRELENAMERASLMAVEGSIAAEDLPRRMLGGGPQTAHARRAPEPAPPNEAALGARLAHVEESAIRDAMSAHDGNVSAVCRSLSIPRSTLYRRLRAMGLR